jgi:hypothetical protein
VYYYNSATGESVWEKPDSEQALPTAAPPGKIRVSHLLVKHAGSRRVFIFIIFMRVPWLYLSFKNKNKTGIAFLMERTDYNTKSR